MINTFTHDHFCYWIDTMNISYEEAAELLGVTLSTIENYAYGLVKVSPDHAAACRLLLKLKTQRVRESL